MTTTTKNRATFWKCIGNHPEGADCNRANKWGYPLNLIRYVAFYGGEGVKVYSTTADQFGKTIIVDAPKSTWEEAWVNCAKEMAMENPFDEIVKDENGLWWGLILDHDDKYVELFQSDKTKLEMVQEGYIGPIINKDGEELWLECKSIARGV